MQQKAYIIPGNPIPLARPRFAHGNVYDCQKDEKHATATYLRFLHKGDLFKGQLHASIKFFMQHKTKSGWHCVRPDLDNMIKFYLDVATGILYEDDKQISKITAEKVYDSEGRTEITITELTKKG